MQINDLIYCRIENNENIVNCCKGIIYHIDQDYREFHILVNGTTYCVSKHNITQIKYNIDECKIIRNNHMILYQTIESMSEQIALEFDRQIIDVCMNIQNELK